MNDKLPLLKIFNFSHPLMRTEALALLGDKYAHGLPFRFAFVETPEAAEVIAWDGVLNPKNASYVEVIVEELKRNKILLLLGESATLVQNHRTVELFDLTNLNFVEGSGWNALPEEILQALETCHQKLRNV